MSAEITFHAALALYRQGRLTQARELCTELVGTNPRHHGGLHLLGSIALQSGEIEFGLARIRDAIAADPSQRAAYGAMGNALLSAGRAEEALPYYQIALQLNPDDAIAHNSLGVALREAGQPLAALMSFDRALAVDPGYARAHNNRGNALRDLHRLDEALLAYDLALRLDGGNLLARNNRLRLLEAMGRSADAPPLDAVRLGDRELAEGRPQAALDCYDQHLRMHRDDAEALNRRGVALLELKRTEEAVVSFQHCLRLAPDNAPAHNNLGNAYRELDRYESALGSYARAVELAPSVASFWFHQAQILMAMDRSEDAIESLDRTLELAPDHGHALGTRVAAQRGLCDWSGLEDRLTRLAEAVRADRPAVAPFQWLISCDDPALHLQCARRLAAERFSARATLRAGEKPRQHERIRLAYLSADFHGHATSYLMAGLFEQHDRERFEVSAYSFGPDRRDDMRKRLVRAFDRFVDVRHLDDAAVAQLLVEHGIDIAVDLKGYTHLGRSGILAYRPAPIQVSYLGYPGTLGTGFIDYIVADCHVIPPDQQQHYTERVVSLPDCYQVNDSSREIAPRRLGRAEWGLPEHGFVYCCFNSSGKLGPEVFDIWMRLLRQVPGSVLWLLADHAATRRNLIREAVQRGVDAERLVFAQRLPHAEHLARLAQADLFLDTLPYNAHTTSSDALWAGVPVLTCCGQAFAGRVAMSLLHAVGLPELVTDTLADYETEALRLAGSPARLQSLRERLAQRRTQAPLFDTARFRRHLEAAYTVMWQRHQHGLAPEAFEVPALSPS
jgi:predicted O-linked N-acetylglucosamine transferase (SPINDLY family)